MYWAAWLLYISLTYFSVILASQDNPVKVIGLLHQSVELLSNLSHPTPVQEINWHVKSKEKSNKIAQFGNNQSKFYNNQFNGRLKLFHDGTTLQIKDLRMEDTGFYTAIFVMEQGDRFAYFMLMVYEPIPDPSIRIVPEERTSHWCNVTLQCSVPTNSSSLNYSWIYRNTDSVYELSGDAIHISLNYSWDLDFQCIVDNPAGRKNVSKQAKCYVADGLVKRMSYIILISVLLILLILCLVIWKIRRKGSSKLSVDGDQAQGTTSHSEHRCLSLEEGETGAEIGDQEVNMLYCEPTYPTDNPPRITTQYFSWNERGSHVNPPPQKFKTLYTSLQRK